MKGLNARQTRFVSEYLIDLNATQAYLRVYGGGEKAAQVSGCQLLSNPRVAAAVAVGKGRQLASSELSAARVLEELKRLAFGDRVAIMKCQTVADFEKLPPELRALVDTGFEIFEANIKGVRDGKTDRVRRVRTVPKGQALEMLAKHFKLLTEVSELTASTELLARLDRGRERNAAAGADRRKRQQK